MVGNHVEPKASYCNKKHSEEDSGCSNWCSKGTGVVLAQFETWTWNNVIHKSKSLNHWCSKGTEVLAQFKLEFAH